MDKASRENPQYQTVVSPMSVFDSSSPAIPAASMYEAFEIVGLFKYFTVHLPSTDCYDSQNYIPLPRRHP